MNANELRIGNLTYMKSKNKIYMVDCGSDIDKSDDLEPIPLTKEWLLKFGFEKNRDSFSKNIGLFSKEERLSFSGGDLYITDSEKSNTIPTDIIMLWDKDVMKNFYVHQLQNLYYALTGEELILKND